MAPTLGTSWRSGQSDNAHPCRLTSTFNQHPAAAGQPAGGEVDAKSEAYVIGPPAEALCNHPRSLRWTPKPRDVSPDGAGLCRFALARRPRGMRWLCAGVGWGSPWDTI